MGSASSPVPTSRKLDLLLATGQTRSLLTATWPMATMVAMQAGVKLPVMLPQLGHIAKDMQPSLEYSYLGPDGFYSRYQGLGLEMGLRQVAVGSLAMGVLMPALARVRQGRKAYRTPN